jgi:ABC-2 type transport system permease protein
MRKVLVIAAREYQAAIRTKSFVISLLILPLLIVGSSLLQVLVRKQFDIDEKHIAVVDLTPGGKIFPFLKEAADLHNRTDIYDPQTGKQTQAVFDLQPVTPASDTTEAVEQLRYDLSEKVLREQLFGFVEIGPDVCKLSIFGRKPADQAASPAGAYLRYQTNHPTYQKFPIWANLAIVQAISLAEVPEFARKSLREALQSPRAMRTLQLKTLGLSKRDAASGKIEDPPVEHVVARILVPIGLVMVMYFVVLLGATPAMQGVVEEKSQRIAEVLLGSVRPFGLMAGKLLGLMGVSLTVAAVHLTGAFWMARSYGVTEFFTPGVVAWFLLFQALALVMYGSLFLAVGAAASDVKEAGTLVTPLVLLLALPLCLLPVLLENPNNAAATAASFFPFVTPMLMMSRLAVPPGVPWWQPVAGIAAVLATTALCVYAAGRIFRVGILMQGKGARLRDLVRWVARG